MKNIVLLLLTFSLSFIGCQSGESPASGEEKAKAISVNESASVGGLDDYWYQGKAELSRYELSQNRYKDNHPGEVVLIFVTEDFLTDKQVKNDHYTNPNSIPILKNNIVKQFPTGIYTYHIMTSVFTPVQTGSHPKTLKVSNSSQEWCGQAYMQLNYNKKKDAYDYLLHSYFEDEADKTGQVKGLLLEDELFNRIRINPESLPLGNIQLLPAAEYSRLTHRPYSPVQAEATIADYTTGDFPGEELRVYTLRFSDLSRTLEVVFENKAPYRIAGWKDTYPSMFDKQPRTTVARRTNTILDDYWKHNSLADMDKRQELGLD